MSVQRVPTQISTSRDGCTVLWQVMSEGSDKEERRGSLIKGVVASAAEVREEREAERRDRRDEEERTSFSRPRSLAPAGSLGRSSASHSGRQTLRQSNRESARVTNTGRVSRLESRPSSASSLWQKAMRAVAKKQLTDGSAPCGAANGHGRVLKHTGDGAQQLPARC